VPKSNVTALRGYTRTKTGAVISMDHTEYEIIKRERRRKKSSDAMEKEIHQLKDIVMMLAKELKEMKGG
jgi:hypothetical protein